MTAPHTPAQTQAAPLDREALADIICPRNYDPENTGPFWDELRTSARNNALEKADAILARLSPAQGVAVPAGYALVPVEPTSEMIEAAYASIATHWYIEDGDEWAKSYRAAVAAALSPTSEASR